MPNKFVEKLRGYARLSPRDIALLASMTRTVRDVPAGHDLVHDGDEPGPVFVILDGWACHYKLVHDGGRQIVAFLIPGDSCSVHVGLLETMDHSIGTLTAATIAMITRTDVDRLVAANPVIARALARVQLVEAGTLREWIVNLGRRDSTERLAHLMCELYVRMRNVGLTTDHSCRLPLTQAMLADALGLTAIHVNRVLRRLREKGVMDFVGGNLIINDISVLVRIAGFDATYLHRRMRHAADKKGPAGRD